MQMYLTSLKRDEKILSLGNYQLEPRIDCSISESANVDDDAMQIEEEGKVNAVQNLQHKLMAGTAERWCHPIGYNGETSVFLW